MSTRGSVYVLEGPRRLNVGQTLESLTPLHLGPPGQNHYCHLTPIYDHGVQPFGADLTPELLRTVESPQGAISGLHGAVCGQCMENVWNFSAIYPEIPAFTHAYSKWQRGAEQHIDPVADAILPAYWKWRADGMNHSVHVPFTGSLAGLPGGGKPFAYIRDGPSEPQGLLSTKAARLQIYCRLYAELAPGAPSFSRLQETLNRGDNVILVHDRVPAVASNKPAKVTRELVQLALNTTSLQTFGPAPLLGALLLGHEDWFQG
jgi:hypothetical protein